MGLEKEGNTRYNRGCKKQKMGEYSMLQDNHGINAAGHLTLAGVDVVDLAKEYGTPLYVLDEERIRARMRSYAKTMSEVFPRGSMPLMASKALCFKEMYRIADSEGIGADIVSGGELYTALAAGFPAEKLCFHGSAKTMDEIRQGVKAGVGFFVVDNEEELLRVSRVAGECGTEQAVLLRITPGIDPHTFEAVNTGRVDCKFGAAIETGQALELTAKALAAPHIQVKGFHCHIGSQIFEPQPILDAVDIMTQFMADVRRELGFTAERLNLGGGVAVPYVAGQPSVDIAAFLRRVGEHLTARCEARELPVPAVFVEPGRSLVADAGITLYTVQSIKSITGYKDYVAIDGGMTDNPRYALYGSEYTALVANRAAEPADYIATVAGRCCESGDLIGEDMPIQRARVDDILAVLVTGAYNYSMASNYNRVPCPPVVMIRDGQARVVVRRQTYEDIAALDL